MKRFVCWHWLALCISGGNSILSSSNSDDDNLPACPNSFSNSTEFVVSPLATRYQVVTRLMPPSTSKPGDNASSSAPSVAESYFVRRQPTDTQQPIFNVNATGHVFVDVDDLFSAIDLTKNYSKTLPPLEIVAKFSSQQSCIYFLHIRFYDPMLAVEPDWDANPILKSEYHFKINCHAPASTEIGVVGDELRSDVYNVTYTMTTGKRAHKDGSDVSMILFRVEPKTGRILTALQLNKYSSEADEKMYRFHVAASAPDQSTKSCTVYVTVSSCDRQTPPETTTTTTTVGPSIFESSVQELSYTVAAPECGKHSIELGATVATLPKTFNGKRIVGYEIYQPQYRNLFSVTLAGAMRVIPNAPHSGLVSDKFTLIPTHANTKPNYTDIQVHAKNPASQNLGVFVVSLVTPKPSVTAEQCNSGVASPPSKKPVNSGKVNKATIATTATVVPGGNDEPPVYNDSVNNSSNNNASASSDASYWLFPLEIVLVRIRNTFCWFYQC